jgi:hypothetical protein
MLTFLNGKRQTAIAWFFLIIFYVDMLAGAYASTRVYNFAPMYTNTSCRTSSSSDSNNAYEVAPPQIEAKLISKSEAPKKELLKSESSNTGNVNSTSSISNKEKASNAVANKEENKNLDKVDTAAGPGPGQPEMATFKSVGADNMVNLFTGDFSYNIPLLDVDGYPINIFYNAGPTMDQEASWVGLGWNINPGTINRNMRGLPDDFDGSGPSGDKVTKEMSVKPDWTIGVSGTKNKEIVGIPKDGKIISKTKPGFNGYVPGIFYNNKRGLGFELSKSVGIFSTTKKISEMPLSEYMADGPKDIKSISTSLNLNLNLNSQTGLSAPISFSRKIKDLENNTSKGFSTSIDFNSRTGLGDLRFNSEITKFNTYSKDASDGSFSSGQETGYSGSANLRSSSISFSRSSYTPSINMPISQFNAVFNLKVGRERKGIFKNTNITGYYSRSWIKEKHKTQNKPAFGYMYYEKGDGNKNAMLDFNRLNDGGYTKKTPVISIPSYTYDIFNISGEGTGGNFRAYRGNMGFVEDAYSRTSSGKLNVTVELGAQDIFHGGTEIGGIYARSFVQPWLKENNFRKEAKFDDSYKLIEKGFYFKNPNEKAIIDEEYYNNMGQDNLMRLTMFNGAFPTLNPPFVTQKTTLNNKFQLYNDDLQKTIKIDFDKNNTYRKIRDKRTQVISFLNAEEADRVGLDRNIKAFQKNNFNLRACKAGEDDNTVKDFFETKKIRRLNTGSEVEAINYRKKHHISEITVQEGSKRYIYGLPVYELAQTSVTMSVYQKAVDGKGQITYNDEDNSFGNTQGKDGLFQREKIGAFPHSFLLTAILSPDYSDISGNGISDDDLGTAIKFNYCRLNYEKIGDANRWNNLNWRMPADPGANKANFNRGLVTDDKDDKATYTEGSKELWYTHSIESKNMIAKFWISNRKDGWGLKKSNGAIAKEDIDVCQQKLDRIELFSKADLIKYKGAAKPIKTVHFKYAYNLCKNYSMNSGEPIDEDGNNPSNSGKPNINVQQGKLTLKKIYFTYNNNNHQKNNYVFKYANEEDAVNPEYNPQEYDRWGTYKPHTQNPIVGLSAASNEDMPYTPQNKMQADANAATWSLNKILLPSGAKIDVNYEADDYAYVQDRKAEQMTHILGLGFSPNATPTYKLYETFGFATFGFSLDYRYVFFDAPVPVNSVEDINKLYLQKYLKANKTLEYEQLLLKLWVQMPDDKFYGTIGYEPIFVYCNIEEVGLAKIPAGQPGAGNDDPTRFYIKVAQATRNTGSQIMETVNQYLRDMLPGKAFPGSDLSNKSAGGQLIRSLYGMVNNVRTGVTGFEKNARLDKWCLNIEPNKSVARLCNPYSKKLGGGHRVKSIIITDNWKKMSKPNDTNAPEIDSYYGQEYNYSTTKIENGVSVNISSGVASYEPGLGNEENPFREMLQYKKSNITSPIEKGNIELPVAETYYPTSSVGYSRVTVQSIHSKNKENPAENKNLKAGVGMQETQFYTTKDFPTLSQFTSIEKGTSLHNFQPKPILELFNFASKNYMTIVQGFRVQLNDMNGKTKMQASYAENDLQNAINKTIYHYRLKKKGENKYSLDNIVPTVAGPDGKIENKLIGKDIEVMNDLREHFSHTRSLTIPLNVEFFEGGGLPILIPTVFRAVFRDETLFRSATTLKVVNEYGILDSVENVDKGSVVGTKNLVYNAETGDVMVSRTENEFKKPIYNFSYPAYWAVEDMGPAYKNIGGIFKHLTFRHGKIDAGLLPDDVNKYFASGDEIYVLDHSTKDVKENPACDANATCGNATFLKKSSEFRIWALDVTKDTRLTTKEFIFIDRNGVPYNANDADIKIIRSGRRNMMDAAVGSITSMANPIVNSGIQESIVINNATNVVNTGAIEYKEKWKTQDAFWVLKEPTTITHRAPVKPIVLFPTKTYSIIQGNGKDKNINGRYDFFDHLPDYFSFTARKNNKFLDGARNKFINYNQKSWILFDLNIVGNAIVHSAKLSLFSHTDFPTLPPPHNLPRRLNHSQRDPHQYNNRRGLYTNDFQLSRMKSNIWPGNFSGQWENIFLHTPSNLEEDQTIIQGPWNRYPAGTFNYVSPFNRIEVGKILQGMINDKYNNNNYVTGFRISMPQPSPQSYAGGTDDEIRVCFNNYLGLNDPDVRLNPKLELGVVECDKWFDLNAIPPRPEPTNPPYEIGECKITTIKKTCISVFNGNFINPYVRGLLGNWRPLKSYVYYGERREQDPITNPITNIEKDGIIKDYEPFWNFAASNTEFITKTNSAKWTWNSEITQYNRKGAELENKDPLNRYNASIYGYNEALPIAVVNNSKLRQSAFDGFEDYFFEDLSCKMDCEPNKRHFQTELTSGKISETVAHSGRYSLKTLGNNFVDRTTSIKINISPDNTSPDPNTPDLKIGLNKVTTNFPTINLIGQGINGIYNSNGVILGTRKDGPINIYYDRDHLQDLTLSNNNVADYRGGNNFQWHGKVQVLEQGDYFFASSNEDGSLNVNDLAEIRINGIVVFSERIRIPCPIPAANRISSYFTAGEIKDIDITFCDRFSGRKNTGIFRLMWKIPCSNIYTLVPKQNLYENANATIGAYSPNPFICTKVDQIKPLKNFLIDEFNLIPNKKMVASIWLKKGLDDCKCPQYTGFDLQLRDAAGNPFATFTSKSPVIEGWQLFETEFMVPATGDNIELFINNTSIKDLYVDDLRIHPYNSNMKSFVYNPYNLKPAAELDENNYATFYEYDNDGTLIRVKKETKLGIKTIQETRSSLQKVITNF